MPKTASLNPKMTMQVRLPADLVAKVMNELYSEVEKCIPYGKWSEFIEARIREYYQRKIDEDRDIDIDDGA